MILIKSRNAYILGRSEYPFVPTLDKVKLGVPLHKVKLGRREYPFVPVIKLAGKRVLQSH